MGLRVLEHEHTARQFFSNMSTNRLLLLLYKAVVFLLMLVVRVSILQCILAFIMILHFSHTGVLALFWTVD